MNQQTNPNSCPPPYPDNVFSAGPSGRSRGVAALLAIFLGSLGIQYFYLGKSTAGIISLIVSLCTCGIPSIYGAQNEALLDDVEPFKGEVI